MQRVSRNFNFYGRSLRVQSDCRELLERLAKDFSLYCAKDSSESADLKIEAHLSSGPALDFSHLRPVWQGPKVTVYESEGLRYCYYAQSGQSQFDFKDESAKIWSKDIELLHEITYLMILSRVGKWLDTKGVHRLHACGFRADNKRVLLTMPMGGGKSTFFVEMARNYPEIELLGDDTVLIDSRGGAHPFCIRVGLPGFYHHIFNASTYELQRREFGTKTLLPVERLGPAPLVESPWASIGDDRVILLIGARPDAGEVEPSMQRISRYDAFIELISPMIVGEGLAMILEYFWETGIRDFWVKSRIALLRVRAAWRLASRAECWRIELGTDRGANSRYIREMLKR